MGPAIIGGAAVQVNVLVNTNFATNIPGGSGPVSWLNYSIRLMQFPIGVFGVAIATATLPSISRSAALKDMSEFRHTLAGSIRLAFLLTIPSTIGLIVLGRPIIALIYEHRSFGPNDTDHTSAALACYAIGLAGYAAIKILAPAFYALNDSRTPMMISLTVDGDKLRDELDACRRVAGTRACVVDLDGGSDEFRSALFDHAPARRRHRGPPDRDHCRQDTGGFGIDGSCMLVYQ